MNNSLGYLISENLLLFMVSLVQHISIIRQLAGNLTYQGICWDSISNLTSHQILENKAALLSVSKPMLFSCRLQFNHSLDWKDNKSSHGPPNEFILSVFQIEIALWNVIELKNSKICSLCDSLGGSIGFISLVSL